MPASGSIPDGPYLENGLFLRGLAGSPVVPVLPANPIASLRLFQQLVLQLRTSALTVVARTEFEEPELVVVFRTVLDDEETVCTAISRLEEFFTGMGLPVRLSEMPEIKEPVTEEAMWRMARRVRITNPEDQTVGGLKHLSADDIVNIFKLAL